MLIPTFYVSLNRPLKNNANISHLNTLISCVPHILKCLEIIPFINVLPVSSCSEILKKKNNYIYSVLPMGQALFTHLCTSPFSVLCTFMVDVIIAFILQMRKLMFRERKKMTAIDHQHEYERAEIPLAYVIQAARFQHLSKDFPR